MDFTSNQEEKSSFSFFLHSLSHPSEKESRIIPGMGLLKPTILLACFIRFYILSHLLMVSKRRYSDKPYKIF